MRPHELTNPAFVEVKEKCTYLETAADKCTHSLPLLVKRHLHLDPVLIIHEQSEGVQILNPSETFSAHTFDVMFL